MKSNYKMDITDDRDVMFLVTYGSKLYGTNTDKSDTDLKAIYLPQISDLLLGKKLVATKKRWDADGQPLPDSVDGKALPMVDGGTECEYIPFQTFVRDFVAGQTYAVEVAHAIVKNGPESPGPLSTREWTLVNDLVEAFGNSEVYSMVGFAMKQTMDYVHRGERLTEATKVRDTLLKVQTDQHDANLRLDTMINGEACLDYVARLAGLPTSTTVNNNRTLRTLELNGRSYTESTALSHVLQQLDKMIDSYGERSNRAAQVDVDFKSLSHAVRVYQQAIEVLDTGSVTFPRPNAAFLLRVKSGQMDLEEVKTLLKALDAEVLSKMETSTVRKKTTELQARAERWLLSTLRELYDLD